MKKNIFLIILLGLIALISIVVIMKSSVNSKTEEAPDAVVNINGFLIKAMVAQTMAEKEQGLSGVEAIKEDEGMLFLFDDKYMLSFWMEDMKFPLDIIWIADNQIVDITENAPVPDNTQDLPTYKPCCKADKVLEVNAGFCQRHNITVGTPISLDLTGIGE